MSTDTPAAAPTAERELMERYRRELEIIAVGDVADARAAAEQTLIETGFWSGPAALSAKRCPWPDCPHGTECVHAAPVAAQPAAWLHEDGERVVSARTKHDMVKDGGASASAAKGYSIALGPMDAAQPAASGVDAQWVEKAKALSADVARWEVGMTVMAGGRDFYRMQEGRDKARDEFNAHLSTALTGAAKE